MIRRLVFAILVALLWSSVPARANLIANGSFEDGTFVDNGYGFMSVDPGSTTMPGWTIDAELAWMNGTYPLPAAPSDGVKFLDLTGAHSQLKVSFDLFIIQSWDGNSGPDVWELGVGGGPTLLRTTFSNTPSEQAYHDWYPAGQHPLQTAAAQVDTLGHLSGGWGDSVYRLSLAFPHTGSSVVLNFSGIGFEGVGAESWGLDNVSVATDGCAARPADLVSWWRGEGNANDATGANNGTVSPTGVTFPSGQVGQAFGFDAQQGDKVETLDTPSRNPANVTIEAWVRPVFTRPVSGYDADTIFSKNDSSNGYGFYILQGPNYGTQDPNYDPLTAIRFRPRRQSRRQLIMWQELCTSNCGAALGEGDASPTPAPTGPE